MVKRTAAPLAFLILGGLGVAANAQGHRPAGAGAPAAASRVGAAQPQFDRGQSIERRAEADSKRLEAEAHNRSTEARTQHPPNEHAAAEATLAEQNANHSKRDSAKKRKRHSGKGKD